MVAMALKHMENLIGEGKFTTWKHMNGNSTKHINCTHMYEISIFMTSKELKG